MSKKSRLRFIIGLVSTALFAIGLSLYLQHSMSMVSSTDAQLDSETFTVGVGYSGIIESQSVEEGDIIKQGDPLFDLRSPTLIEALKNNEVNETSLLYEVDNSGKIQITASVDGQVREIQYRAGAFVPASSEIATINSEGSLFVSAVYKLSGPDYAKIDKDTIVSITLPDNKKINGKARDVKLETVDDETLTTVKVRLLNEDSNDIQFEAGTPVNTVINLNGQTWYEKLRQEII